MRLAAEKLKAVEGKPVDPAQVPKLHAVAICIYAMLCPLKRSAEQF